MLKITYKKAYPKKNPQSQDKINLKTIIHYYITHFLIQLVQ